MAEPYLELMSAAHMIEMTVRADGMHRSLTQDSDLCPEGS